MENVKIIGENKFDSSVKLELTLPCYSHYVKPDPVIGTIPDKVKEENFVNSEKYAYDIRGQGGGILTSRSCLKDSDDEKFLKSKLVKYPLPRNSGPVVPHYDTYSYDSNPIVNSTAFVHSEDQTCGKWTPEIEVNDGNLFPIFKVEPYDNNMKEKMEGPCSNKKMSIFYTCNQLKCSIMCSCKICTSTDKNCKLVCRNCPCPRCIPQCPKHRIGLDRAFDIAKHEYSIKAVANDQVKFVVKHTGIPLTCDDCSKDLIDHQTYHKIFHTRCKFCSQIMAPYSFYHVIEIEEYWLAMKKVAKRADKTCSTCLKMFDKASNRRRHEETIHEKTAPFQCQDCEKKFSNIDDLNYHNESQHSGSLPAFCEMCHKAFKTKASLRLHTKRIHSDEDPFKCDECDSQFSQKNNLLRHRNEKHLGQNVDWRLVQFMEDLEFSCDICTKSFKRKSNLNQHKQIVHGVDGSGNPICPIKCSYCKKEFSSKSNCKRHEKQCEAHQSGNTTC